MPSIFASTANKNSKSIKSQFINLTQKTLLVLMVGLLFITSITTPNITEAQSLQQQINELQQENSQARSKLNVLEIEAGSFQEAIAVLQAQIDAAIKQIDKHEAERKKIVKDIAMKQKELDYQEEILGRNIRAMYLEGDISTVEMLATSKSLSEYLDKQQYRDTLQQKINDTMAEINRIKSELDERKKTQDKLIAEQKEIQAQLDEQRQEQARLLSMNQSQQARLDGQLQANSGRIAELRRQQAIENARLWSGGTNRRIDVPDTTGYPWANVQPFPNSYPDPWGMYKRQCVSYTAWKVYNDGKRMPYWGGRGNAKNWANNARAEGIPVYSTPQRGDIAVSTRGTYGHVMYVEEVYGNGTMRISQYNASWDGRYSEAVVSVYGLEYVRFP